MAVQISPEAGYEPNRVIILWIAQPLLELFALLTVLLLLASIIKVTVAVHNIYTL